jgi:hypothetical protein
MWHWPSILPLSLLVLACTAVPHSWSKGNLCDLELKRGAAVRYETWLALLLRGYDPATREVTNPAVDCTGMQVKWDAPANACFDGSLSTTLLPGRPLDERDVVVTPYAEDILLVWVMTGRYASGDALGAVGIVENRHSELVVRAAGALRAYPERTRLRVERLGNTEILIAEGERCPSSDPASCHRAARLLPLHGDRFVPEPIVSEAGSCVSAAWIDLSRQETERLDSGWRRRYQLAAALTFQPALLRIEEQLVVYDLDPQKPNTPPRLFRRANSDRTISLVNGKLVATGQSLWAKVVGARQ